MSIFSRLLSRQAIRLRDEESGDDSSQSLHTTAENVEPDASTVQSESDHSPVHNKPDVSPVQRLRRFITWGLMIDYSLVDDWSVWEANITNDNRHFHGLCRKYCMLLGTQFDSKKDIATAKHQLQRDVFEPVYLLGIPADVMEAFLSFTRFFVHDDGPTACDGDSVICWSQAVLLRLVIDYIILIDATVATEDFNLASRLRERCLALQQEHFPWMLDLRYILQEHKDAQHNNVDDEFAGRGGILDSAFSIQRRDLVDKDQDLDNSDRGSISEESYDDPKLKPRITLLGFPDNSLSSIILLYRYYTFWPNVAHLCHPSRRPCNYLAKSTTSHDLQISGSDFVNWEGRTWYRDGREEETTRGYTSFQPRIIAAKKREFTSGLPTKICVAGFRWINPDGGDHQSLWVQMMMMT
ncbi:hypothetical protein E4T43_04572 [Aureobasidium subglaciale]|nr:hypothetical protein E4T43_04572 [Aureobasidium subglaciale]